MKCGLKTFPLAVDLDDSVKFVEAEFGIKGFAIVIKLYQAIFSRGYYIKWDIDTELLFIRDYCLSEVGRNLVSEVVSSCVRRGVFDSELYNKFSILTSKRIQETFLTATKRSKEVIFEKEYALPIVYTFLDNASKSGKNVNISFKNVDISQQRKEKERKENNLSYKGDCKNEEIEKKLKTFLENNSKVVLDDNSLDFSNVDFNLLDKGINESEFLKQVTSFSWLIRNYDKVIGGFYKTFKQKPKSSFENQREYSTKELNNLVDNFEDFEI